MKLKTSLLAGLVLVAGLAVAAVSIRDYVLDHLKVGPGLSGTSTRQTNIVDVIGLNGTNAFEIATNTVTLVLTNTGVASNSLPTRPILDTRFALRMGTNRWFAVSNAFLVATNADTGKLQTNLFINGILMEWRSESY
jgi:hypothetical protein